MKWLAVLILLVPGCAMNRDSLYTFGDLTIELPLDVVGIAVPLPSLGLSFEFGFKTQGDGDGTTFDVRFDDPRSADEWMLVFRESWRLGGDGGGEEVAR